MTLQRLAVETEALVSTGHGSPDQLGTNRANDARLCLRLIHIIEQLTKTKVHNAFLILNSVLALAL